MDIRQHLSELTEQKNKLDIETSQLITESVNIDVLIKSNKKRIKLMSEQIEEITALLPK